MKFLGGSDSTSPAPALKDKPLVVDYFSLDSFHAFIYSYMQLSDFHQPLEKNVSMT